MHYLEILALRLSLGNASALVGQLLATRRCGRVAAKGRRSLADKVGISWEVLSDPCRIDGGAAVDKAERLVGTTDELGRHRLQHLADLDVSVGSFVL